MPTRDLEFIDYPKFDEYSEEYAEFFVLTRRDGILEARIHEDGESAKWSHQMLQAWGQAWNVFGNDPENEVIILTGTGDHYVIAADQDSMAEGAASIPKMGLRNFERNFLFDIHVPTIGAINGPSFGAHVTAPLMCDITLCTEDTVLIDPHFAVGTVPGDGLGLAFEEMMSTKRYAYYMLTSELIDATTACGLGLVNEVLSRDELLPRAWELAERIMRRPRNARIETHGLVSRALRLRHVRDFDLHLLAERYAIAADHTMMKDGGQAVLPIGPDGERTSWEEWYRQEGTRK